MEDPFLSPQDIVDVGELVNDGFDATDEGGFFGDAQRRVGQCGGDRVMWLVVLERKGGGAEGIEGGFLGFSLH